MVLKALFLILGFLKFSLELGNALEHHSQVLLLLVEIGLEDGVLLFSDFQGCLLGYDNQIDSVILVHGEGPGAKGRSHRIDSL